LPRRRGTRPCPLLIAALRCLAAEIWKPCIPDASAALSLGPPTSKWMLRALDAEVDDAEVLA